MVKRIRSVPDKDIKAAMILFVDLLGFSNRVQTMETKSELREIIDSVRYLRRRFEFNSRDEHTKDVHKILDKKIMAFSDCLVSSVSFDGDLFKSQGIFDTLCAELDSIALNQAEAVDKGYFVRGGIDIGLWYLRHGVLVSPALATAYKIEQEGAVYPVIAISPELHKFLRTHKDRKFYHKDIDPIKSLFQSFVHPTTKKKVYFINYIRHCVAALDWQHNKATREAYRIATDEEKGKIMSDGYMKSVNKFFARHKARVNHELSRAASDSIKQKYIFLAKLHNGELSRFKFSSKAVSELRIKVSNV